MRPYNSFVYLTPPRSEVVLSKEHLSIYEERKFIAQVKKNGTNSIIFVPPERDQVCAWNRHGTLHKVWQPDGQTRRVFEQLPGKNWWVFNGELMHAKTPHIKNIHYLFDVLVVDGMLQTGTTYGYRYDILFNLWKLTDRGEQSHYIIDDYTWLARNIFRDFRKTFDAISAVEDEGLVVKNPYGKYFTSNANSWMVKFRKK